MPAGKHKAGYRRPRTGEKRATRQPLRVDGLKQEVRDAILNARTEGKTWEETAEAASQALGETLSPSVVHRWYDVRVEQVQREVMGRAEAARAIAGEFAAKGFEKLPEATVNALSAEVFALTEAAAPAERKKALGDLLFLLAKLIDAQSKQKRAEIEEEKVKLARRKFEQIGAKVQGVKEAVAGEGRKKLSNAELAKKLDEIYGLTQPNP